MHKFTWIRRIKCLKVIKENSGDFGARIRCVRLYFIRKHGFKGPEY